MKISVFIIAAIVGAAMLASFGLFMGDLAQDYSSDNLNASGIEEFTRYEDRLDTIYGNSSQIFDESKEDSGEIPPPDGFLDVVGKFLGAGIAAIKVSFTSIDIFITMSEDSASLLQVPKIWQVALVSLIFVLLAFALIRAKTKVDV